MPRELHNALPGYTPGTRTIPQPGETWRHFEGGLVEIVGLSSDAETERTLITYVCIGTAGLPRSCSLFKFMQVVTPEEGKHCFRFSRVGPEDSPAEATGVPQDATDDVPVPGPSPNPPDDVHA